MVLSPNPNMLNTPGIRPPFPAWSPTTLYYLGDVVTYAGQNWLCFFNDTPGQSFAGDYPPDTYPVTLTPNPTQSPGIYKETSNPNGASWINLTLATPPAQVWSSSIAYQPGSIVMYPAWSPGSYWVASQFSVGRVPSVVANSSNPNNVNNNFVQNSPNFNTVSGVSGDTQYWQPLKSPLSGSPAQPLKAPAVVSSNSGSTTPPATVVITSTTITDFIITADYTTEPPVGTQAIARYSFDGITFTEEVMVKDNATQYRLPGAREAEQQVYAKVVTELGGFQSTTVDASPYPLPAGF